MTRARAGVRPGAVLPRRASWWRHSRSTARARGLVRRWRLRPGARFGHRVAGRCAPAALEAHRGGRRTDRSLRVRGRRLREAHRPDRGGARALRHSPQPLEAPAPDADRREPRVATAHRGKLYVHGGYTARRDLTSATNRLYVYDPGRDRWRRLPDSRGPRAAHAFAVIGGQPVRGRRSQRDGRSHLDGGLRRRAAGAGRRGPSFRGPRRDHMTGVASGGYFYALAGREGTTQLHRRRALRPSPPALGATAADAPRPRRHRLGRREPREGGGVRRRGLRHRQDDPRGRAVRPGPPGVAAGCRTCAPPATASGESRCVTASTRSRVVLSRAFTSPSTIEFLDVR